MVQNVFSVRRDILVVHVKIFLVFWGLVCLGKWAVTFYSPKFLDLQLEKVVKHKRPSRRHRRRPKNLLEEYQRRQRKHVWLETHIWHAKRFKMEDRWGYRLPLHSTDKGIKASYRATQHYCQIQVSISQLNSILTYNIFCYS